MIGAIKVALAAARRDVGAMLRTRPSADRRWCYVPTEEIHEASQRALRGADLELFVESSTIEGETLTVAYRIYKLAGEGIGSHEEYKHSILIDRGERRTTLTAGALAILDRRVRMSLLDIVSMPSEERQTAERPAVNPYIRRPGVIEEACGPDSYVDDHAPADPRPRPTRGSKDEDLSAEADAVIEELTGPMPDWADPTDDPAPSEGPDAIEVWKAEATRAWIETSKVCANAGISKPDISALIEDVVCAGSDADDLTADGWAEVVVRLGIIKDRAVQAIVEGVAP